MVFHLCVRNFLINAFYIEYLGCRCGNRSDACDSVGFSRATSECPHHEVKSDTCRIIYQKLVQAERKMRLSERRHRTERSEEVRK